MIRTVLGDIHEYELGFCQSHEHLFIRKGVPAAVDPSLHMDSFGKSLKELKLYRKCGGESIVDAQPVGCGRMAGHLAKASFRAGVHIMASTGFHKLVFYGKDHWIFNKDADVLSRLFIKEINDGMYQDGDGAFPRRHTGYRAGIIKAALNSCGIDGAYEKLLDAAANASLETGAPILCHVEKGGDAVSLVEFLSGRGLKPESIILCHLDRALYDIPQHLRTAGMGVYLEYDTIGRPKYHSDEMEIELILQLIEHGFEDRILFGLDTTSKRMKSYGGAIGLDYIKAVFLQKLADAGVDAGVIGKITRMNPQNALSIKKLK